MVDFIGMVFHRHAAIGFLDFVVADRAFDLEDAVGRVGIGDRQHFEALREVALPAHRRVGADQRDAAAVAYRGQQCFDEQPRAGNTAESLAKLKPAFKKDGSVTAGNASSLNDGAAAVMLMSAAKAQALGLPVLAKIAAYANAGVDPAIMGIGPVSATQRCLSKAGWSLEQLDLIEANEAFAAQALSVGKELNWDTDKVNVNGGAIAIGHPIGASGCRILVTLLHEMIKRDAKKGLATLCIGGGQGVALAIERE